MGFQEWGKDELKKVTEELKKIPADKRSAVRNSIKDLNTASEALAAVRTVSALISNISESPANPSETILTDKEDNIPILDENRQEKPVNALERVTGEEIHDTFDIIALENTVKGIIENFCLTNNIDDLVKAPQRQFTALCMDIGQYMRKSRILKDTTLVDNGSCALTTQDRYNWEKVAQALTIYEHLCCMYNKAYLQDGAAAFVGMSINTLHDNASKLSPFGIDIAQKREMSLASGAIDARGNVTGQLAALNHWHGWTTAKTSTEKITEKTIIYPTLISSDGLKIGVASGEK